MPKVVGFFREWLCLPTSIRFARVSAVVILFLGVVAVGFGELAAPPTPPTRLASADFDRDGNADLLVARGDDDGTDIDGRHGKRQCRPLEHDGAPPDAVRREVGAGRPRGSSRPLDGGGGRRG